MTPKSLLRLPEARSNIDEMTDSTEFQRIIADCGPATDSASHVTRLLFCSGKVYYELAKERADKNLQADVAITRLEQVPDVFTAYSNVRHFINKFWNYFNLFADRNIRNCRLEENDVKAKM